MLPKSRQEIKHTCRYNPERASKDYWFLQDALEKRTEENKKLRAHIDWFRHYIMDKQYEKIKPEKDFELRDILKEIKEIR